MRIYGETIASRLLLGTAQYPSPAVLQDAIRASGTGLVTVSLRRETVDGAGEGFWPASCPTPPAATPSRKR